MLDLSTQVIDFGVPTTSVVAVLDGVATTSVVAVLDVEHAAIKNTPKIRNIICFFDEVRRVKGRDELFNGIL